MNLLAENNLIAEMSCGTNFAYILSDNNTFLPTEYKVLQNQGGSCFVKCMKMMYNGKTQLYYLTNAYKPFSTMIPKLDADSFLTIVGNLFTAVTDVKNNGFLSCQNIDISFEKIYVDQSTYKVSLVYIPLNRHVFDDASAFENELRTELVKLIANISTLSSPKTMQLSSDLQNGSYSVEDICSRIAGKGVVHNRVESDTQSGTSSNTPSLKLIAMNAPARLELSVTKPEFIIGKKDSNDGVVSFNKMISRVHCKIICNGTQYWITDLQSANGTFVNRVRLQPNQPHLIKNGDLIRLANSDFQAVIG